MIPVRLFWETGKTGEATETPADNLLIHGDSYGALHGKHRWSVVIGSGDLFCSAYSSIPPTAPTSPQDFVVWIRLRVAPPLGSPLRGPASPHLGGYGM
jgi:hypothetical protein